MIALVRPIIALLGLLKYAYLEQMRVLKYVVQSYDSFGPAYDSFGPKLW